MLRVKEILKAKGMTAKELAKLLNVSEGSLSLTIKDGANPSVQTLEKIATALGVPVAELFETPKDGVITCPHCGKRINIEVKSDIAQK